MPVLGGNAPEPRRLRGRDGTTPVWPHPHRPLSLPGGQLFPLAQDPFPELGNSGARARLPAVPRTAGSGSARRRRPGGGQVAARAAEAERAMEHVTEGSWESLPMRLHPRVLGALRELGFPYMTPVQVPGAAGRGRVFRAPEKGVAGGAGRLRAGRPPAPGLLPRLQSTLVNDAGGWEAAAPLRQGPDLLRDHHSPPLAPVSAGAQVRAASQRCPSSR